MNIYSSFNYWEKQNDSGRKRAASSSSLKEFILNSNYKELGKSVITCNEIVNSSSYSSYEKEKVEQIVTVCRRKFRIGEVILFVSDGDYQNSLVFTEDRIYSIFHQQLDEEIKYSEIAEIDFDNYYGYVIVKLISNEEKRIFWPKIDYKEYYKNMYNFIMDIKDWLQYRKNLY